MLFKTPSGESVPVTVGKVWGNCVQLIERTSLPKKPREWVVVNPTLIEEAIDALDNHNAIDIEPSQG